MKTPKQLISREKLADMVGLSIRQISSLASGPGGIPGVSGTQKGSYVKFFPVVMNSELQQWIKDQRTQRVQEKQQRKVAKVLPLTESKALLNLTFATRAINVYVQGIEQGAFGHLNNAEMAYAMHVRLMPLAKLYGKLCDVVRASGNQSLIAQLKQDWAAMQRKA